VRKLTDSLMRAMARIQDPQPRAQVRSHVSRYSLMETVAGFERAALTVVHQ